MTGMVPSPVLLCLVVFIADCSIGKVTTAETNPIHNISTSLTSSSTSMKPYSEIQAEGALLGHIKQVTILRASTDGLKTETSQTQNYTRKAWTKPWKDTSYNTRT